MNYNESLQVILDYIECHLTEEINLDELGNMIGFSPSHFQRLFMDYTKLTVTHYIIKRKLLHAIYRISQREKGIHIALEYGFETYAGFYKAFKKEFGCSPSIYLKHVDVESPTRFDLNEKSFNLFTYMQLKEILSHWNLPKQIKITHMDGKRRDRWLINNQYVLKYSTQINDVEKVIKVTDELAQHHIPVPTLLKTSEDRSCVYKYDVYFYLEPYYRKVPEEMWQLQQYLELGRTIAVFHQTLKDVKLDEHEKEADIIQVVSEWAVPNIRNNMIAWGSTLPHDFFEDYLEILKELKEQLPNQLIHRKLSINNLVVSETNVVGFRNFELCERNVRLFDLCYLGTSILAEGYQNESKRKHWIKQFNQLVAGYDEHAKLTSIEKVSIVHLLLAIQFIFIAYLKDEDEEKQLLLTNIEIVSFIYEHQHEIGI